MYYTDSGSPLRISIPPSVASVLRTLRRHGYEAYAVGGCVRDSLLGRSPYDWDITTSARPDEVKALFRHTADTGIAHGTVTVLTGGDALEVTTYRIDGAYTDGRHPDSVEFTTSLEEDLRRRDFTINAMACNEDDGLIDLFGGAQDLRQGIIRCVGDPRARFSEDALRILRAVRFSAQLDFSIETHTLEAMQALAGTLSRISAERICTELMKLAGSRRPDRLITAWETGITAVILPEFDLCMKTAQNNPHHLFTVGGHILTAMGAVLLPKPDFWPEQDAARLHHLAEQTKGHYDCRTLLTLVMLLHDIAKPACRTTDDEGIDHFKGHATLGAEMAGTIMRRLKLDNDTMEKASVLILYHDWRVEPVGRNVRRAVSRVGTALFPLLLEVQLADTMAQSLWKREDKMQRILRVFHIYEEILAERQCVQIRDLAVNGKDLLELGVPKGPVVGEMLRLALDDVLEDPSRNERDHLLELIRTNLAGR